MQALPWWLGSEVMSHVCTSYPRSHKPLGIKTTEAQQSFTHISAPCQAQSFCQCLYISSTTSDQHISSPSQPHKKEISLEFCSWPLVSISGHSCSAGIALNKWNLTTKRAEDREWARRVLVKLRVLLHFSMIMIKHGPKHFWEDRARVVRACTSSTSLMSLVVPAPISCPLQGSSSLQKIHSVCGWKRGDHLF